MNNYKIVFMGTPDFGIPSLNELYKQGYEVEAVYTQPDRVNKRGNKVQFSAVKQFALEHDITIYQPNSLKDEKELDVLRALNPDLIIVIAYGKILPQAVLDIPKYGVINVHASLLPKYRGAAPVQRSIIDGEETTGVTIMQLDAGMDTGNIIAEKSVFITPHMTSEDLFGVLSNVGAKLLIDVLDDLPAKLAASVKQDESKATYAEKLTKEMGHINWNDSARTIDRLIRGMYPNPGTYTFYRGKRIKIHEAVLLESSSNDALGKIFSLSDGMLHVKCSDGAIGLLMIQPENHKKMSASDFINGYKVTTDESFEY